MQIIELVKFTPGHVTCRSARPQGFSSDPIARVVRLQGRSACRAEQKRAAGTCREEESERKSGRQPDGRGEILGPPEGGALEQHVFPMSDPGPVISFLWGCFLIC